MPPRSLLRTAAALALALSTSLAAAAPSKQDVARADKLFKEAKSLMAAGKLAQACPKLEESQSLDPAPGTKYQLAVCYEGTGKPATALAFYTEIAELAKAGGYKDKEKVAREKAAAIEPRVPRIVIEVASSSRVSGLAITRDGAPVEEGMYNRPILVDPGQYTIEATAPGKRPFKSTVTVEGEGTKVSVPVRLQDLEDFGKRDEIPKEPASGPSSFGPQRIAGTVVGVLGLGGVVLGTVAGLDAKSAYDKAMGDPGLCPTKTTCYAAGKKLVDTAQTDALISTVGFIGGGVLVAAGVVIIATGGPGKSAPKTGSSGPSATFVPVVTGSYGGVAAAGQF